MVADADERSTDADALDEFPAYGLECLYDDRFDPETVTVYEPRGDGVASAWLTVDVEATVPINRAR